MTIQEFFWADQLNYAPFLISLLSTDPGHTNSKKVASDIRGVVTAMETSSLDTKQ